MRQAGKFCLEAREAGTGEVEHGAVAGESVARVRSHHHRIELEGIAVGVGDAGGGRLADQLRHPEVQGGGDRVADRARAVVVLARGRAPEAAAREGARGSRGSARAIARRRGAPSEGVRDGSITTARKRLGGGGDRRQLQFLLGAEVGEEAALAHPQIGGESADRQPPPAPRPWRGRRRARDRGPRPLPLGLLPIPVALAIPESIKKHDRSYSNEKGKRWGIRGEDGSTRWTRRCSAASNGRGPSSGSSRSGCR